MAKKVAAKLLSENDKIYSILCVGVGYLCNSWGDIVCKDNLPRASGTYTTKEIAEQERTKAIAVAKKKYDEELYNHEHSSHRKYVDDDYFLKQAKSKLDAANDSVIVEIKIKKV